MIEQRTQSNVVAVIGAGPAGIFAAKQLAQNGVQVALINRDIKPGGLAEYGIYPDKLRMKSGLRAQFQQVFDLPNIAYYGNLTIGQNGDLTLEDIRNMGFHAVLVTAGAQGTKRLGFPGEELNGVYHAKELVYHYNHLPPYSEREFCIGRRVVVIGVGNVMLDIANWLIKERQVDEVIAMARRGPAEVKFTRTEFEYVIRNLDFPAFTAEINRVSPVMRSLGQDPEKPLALAQAALERGADTNSPTRFHLRFLSSPVRILGDSHKHVTGFEYEHTTLIERNGIITAQGLGTKEIIPVDNVIFAIGDQVDPALGLPVNGNEFVKNPQSDYPMEGNSYEAYDPDTGYPIKGLFLAGWSRQASTGQVGLTRKDGTLGAQAVLKYLETHPSGNQSALMHLEDRLMNLGKKVVRKQDLAGLTIAEQSKAAELGLQEYKFETNEEMLMAIGMAVPG